MKGPPSDTKELFDLLDLHATKPAIEDPVLAIAQESGTAQSGSPSETALEVDRWGMRRGEELIRDCGRLQRLGLDAPALADCHTAAFDPVPSLTNRCRDARRNEFFAALLQSPDYCELHRSTQLDGSAAELAAVHFAEAFAQFRTEASAEGSEAPVSDLQREVAALRAAHRAVTAAQAEVAEGREILAAFGRGPGSPGGNDPRAIAELFRRVRNDAALRDICTLAGRFRRLAQSRQRRKTRHGLDDVVGVDFGADWGRVLPHELAKLATPPFDLEALRRFGERQLMCREHHASEAVGQGPIVVVVDESGSMEGEPVHAAKSIALAMAWIARQQRRWCALIAYSGDSGERLLALPAERWDENALADWLSAFLGRGSTLDVPIAELPRMLQDLKAPAGQTDVIVLTDCVCQIPLRLGESFNSWKATGPTRVITLVLGPDAGDLRSVSDEVHLVQSLTSREVAVGRILSL